MHPIAKRIFIAAAAIAALVGLGAFGVNISIQSEAFQNRLRDSLTRLLGGEVSIRSIYFTPWTGVVVSGLDIQGSGVASRIDSIRVRLAILPLFAGRLAVRKLEIRGPKIDLPTSELPLNWPINSDAREAPKITSRGSSGSARPSPAASPWEFEVEAVEIRDGSLSFPGPAGLPRLTIEGLLIDAREMTGGMANGRFKISKARVAPGVVLTDLTGSFDCNNSQFLSNDISADWSGGKIAAQFEWINDPAPRFRFQTTASGVLLSRMMEDSGYSPEGTAGTLNAQFHLSGAATDRQTWIGASSLRLDHARILPVESIRQLGQMLGVAELQSLELESATANLSAQNGRIGVDQARIATKNLRFDATGHADWDGRLDLQARFHISESLRNDTRGILGSGFQPSDEPGFSHLPFRIDGTLARPQADLVEKLVGLRIGQDVGGFLKNLFQVPKKEKKKKPQPALP